MKTFIIDDDQISLFLTQHILELEKFSDQISTFLGAEEALETLKNLAEEEMPRLILLDLNMPDMNGWEFLQELAPLREKLLGRCYIYILTSSLDFTDNIKAKENELVRDLLHKPIHVDDLNVILADIEGAADTEEGQ